MAINIELSNREIHYTRVVDILIAAINKDMGISVTQNLALKEFQQFSENLAKSEDRFRDIITKNTPAIYLVKFADIASTVKKSFDTSQSIQKLSYTNPSGQQETIEIDYRKDVEAVILDKDKLNIAAQDPNFESDLVKWLHNDFYGKVTNFVQPLEMQYRKQRGGTVNLLTVEYEKDLNLGRARASDKKVSVEFLKQKSLAELDNIVIEAHIEYTDEVKKLQASPKENVPYTAYESLAIRAGKKVITEVRKLGTFLENNIQNVIQGVTQDTAALVVSSTFNSAQENVNKILQASIINFLTTRLNGVPVEDVLKLRYKGAPANEKYFSIGNLVNAGHTAAFVGLTSFGVNMPSAQKVSCLVDIKVAQELEKALSNLYFDIDYTVNFTQEYASKIGKYVGFQFAIVVNMPAALNTKGLNRAEQSLIKAFAGRITRNFNKVLSSKSALYVKEALDRMPTTKASYNIIQADLSEIFSIFDPKKYKPARYSKNNKSNKTLAVPAKIKLKTKPIKLQTSAGKGKTVKVPGTASKTVKVPPKNTESLLNLSMLMMQINNSLHDQIKASMGTGNSRNVLNYRTGRLASSAKVERLSESRQGMITAFYSYMKNPYATFSRGGLQEIPSTRDPKTLISKSIRVLAGAQVANRMRAVLI